jgi:predicted nucleotidyltransferase
MQTFGNLIRTLRLSRGYPLRKVAAALDIDQAILSKIERGQRKIRKEHVIRLAGFFDYDQKEMMLAYLSDRIVHEVGEDEYAKEAMKLAEEKIVSKVSSLQDREKIIKKIAEILNRFPGVSKAWIFGSFSRREDDTHSDIDIAVQTIKGFSYFDLAEIQYQLENQFKRKVDIGFVDSFRPEILKNVRNELKLIYEKQKA